MTNNLQFVAVQPILLDFHDIPWLEAEALSDNSRHVANAHV
jgi:hypothetical protein